MKKTSTLLFAVLVVSAACDSSTSPVAIAAPQTASNYASFRPPPPLDGYIGVSSSEFNFTVSATYFMNGPENNGWISFSKNQPSGVSLSSPSAKITIHDGALSGSGALSFTSGGQTYVIDLSTGLAKGNFSTACSGSQTSGTFTRGDGGGSCGSFEVTATSGQRSIQGFAVFLPGSPVVTVGQ